jgi:mRNA-degrading endonuclease RelE of RelBE toxin-antitoxin system
MKIFFTRRFLKEVKLLPFSKQKKLAESIEFLEINPFNPKLHTKKLSAPLAGVLSFRIGIDYRALFIFIDKDTIKLIRVNREFFVITRLKRTRPLYLLHQKMPVSNNDFSVNEKTFFLRHRCCKKTNYHNRDQQH